MEGGRECEVVAEVLYLQVYYTPGPFLISFFLAMFLKDPDCTYYDRLIERSNIYTEGILNRNMLPPCSKKVGGNTSRPTAWAVFLVYRSVRTSAGGPVRYGPGQRRPAGTVRLPQSCRRIGSPAGGLQAELRRTAGISAPDPVGPLRVECKLLIAI